ncbi:tRNA (guanine(26)-N(2))-dimethyltransferase [Haloarchaeobius iranensis]|uniref:tRNA (guanine(26)-N(2))-dimethyltransferase n=1 Tax=Haloarchaeobius iranensis TaxID=996166 RepID=A0A1G9VCX9_9EURY|nr:tRNA (guanine(26)-N(2))-dimethyltransferase [Haloarchaeobius iranensis]SDM69971.1 N(2),N(2)-dimethylguanosine tRNA methyltransferase [Haloarchaeobius iranensis]
MDVTEGNVTVSVPAQDGEGTHESVFFNPVQEFNRDLTVAVLRAYREHEERADTYLDAMTASGIRGARAAAEGWNVTCCDVDEEAVELARENLARNDLDAEVVHRNVNALMHEDYFDVVDLDPFGTPMPFADAAFANTRDLLCVTATDTAPLCGAHFDSGVRSYAAVPRNTDYHAEMGVRILLGALARAGARWDTGITPLLTHATNHYVRTYLDLSGRATDANESVDELGFLHHCEDCLRREPEQGLIPHPPETCPRCDGNRVLTAGPVWLGPYRDPEFVADVRDRVTDDMGTADRAQDLCDTLEAELDEPSHYDQHRLCKLWGRGASGMDEFLDALRESGFAASRAHYGGTTFKSDASIPEMEAATEDR